VARVESIRIKNFRSIGPDTQAIELGTKITILVGPNNSGKSNILEALRLSLSTRGESQCEPDDINLSVRRQIEKHPDPGMMTLSEIQMTLSLADEDMEHALSAARLNLESQTRASRQLPLGVKDWEEIDSILEQVWNEVFSDRLLADVSIFRKQDGSFSIDSSLNNYGRLWTGEHSDVVHKLEEIRQSHRATAQTSLQVHISGLASAMIPVLRIMPRTLPTDVLRGFIGYEELQKQTLDHNNLRNFLLMMSDPVKARLDESVYETLRESILAAFDDIDEMEPTLERWTGNVEVMFTKRGLPFELRSQGDGVKHMLMFFVLLHFAKGGVVIVDEPENHLHPTLEEILVEFFLEFGQGQLVMATHSDTLVSAISDDRIDSGEVVIYGVGLDEANNTYVTRSTKAEIVDILGDLGVTTSRYQKHMAALHNTLVLVEGKSDKQLISSILQKFDKMDEFTKYRPYFLPYGGKRVASALSSELIDSLRKAEDTLETPLSPYVIVRDRDEEVVDGSEPVDSHVLTLSVREIENLVLSKESILKAAGQFLEEIGIDEGDDALSAFEQHLMLQVEEYFPKWMMLRFRWRVSPILRPLWRHIKEVAWSDTKNEMRSILEDFESRVKGEISKLENLDAELAELSDTCMPEGRFNYPFIAQNLPGKDLQSLIRRALVDTASDMKPNCEIEEVQRKASDMTKFKVFLENTQILPPDIGKLLLCMEQVQPEK